jgi:hypothetical protein
MEQELLLKAKQAQGTEAKSAALKVLQRWRTREAMISKHGSEEAADAAIAAAEAKLVADKVKARERELAGCGDRRALEFQIAPTIMDHRTSQG